jgi:hypothetical protein
VGEGGGRARSNVVLDWGKIQAKGLFGCGSNNADDKSCRDRDIAWVFRRSRSSSRMRS